MLRETLAEYVRHIEDAARGFPNASVEEYRETALTDERVNVHARIRSERGHLLEISEAVLMEGDRLNILSYSYHFQDPYNALIFRYDSAPHHRGLPTFPHHKHLPNAVTPSIKPTVQQVIQEALAAINPPNPATGTPN